ncbi:hypothetical protein M8818_004541 [Zalaria obscura]|uniref:Uncharacterized protein n=1 Tax=Zalaria obscura TaxID=2024903 RepID=A0ACC3SBI0_9PEZI
MQKGRKRLLTARDRLCALMVRIRGYGHLGDNEDALGTYTPTVSQSKLDGDNEWPRKGDSGRCESHSGPSASRRSLVDVPESSTAH